MGRIALLVVLLVVFGVIVQDAVSYLSTRAQAAQQHAIVQRLTRENAQLVRQQKELNDPSTIVRYARALGMVRTGERPYVVTGLPQHWDPAPQGASAINPQQVIDLWREGERRLRESDPQERPVLERVRDELVFELRRRLGGPFTTEELAQLYLTEGTDWCFQVATSVAPGTPAAWDLTTVAGAAFARYVREANDYAGGRRTAEG